MRKGAPKPETAPAPANDDRKPAIVTARRRGSRYGAAPDLTLEHRRRGEGADALFRKGCCGGLPVSRDQASATALAQLRHDPLPTGAEALNEPFSGFPSWFMRITCDRCGQERMFSETHSAQGDMLIRNIVARMRHDGCGRLPGTAELLTGIEGASSRPVRRILLVGG